MKLIFFLLFVVCATANAGWFGYSSGGTSLPSQTSNSGKYLTTDGTNSSWGTVTVPVNDAYVAYTPTIGNCGTASGVSFFSRRNGPDLEGFGTFVCTTPGAGLCSFTLGYNGVNGGGGIAALTAISGTSTVGIWVKDQASSGTAAAATILAASTDTSLYFGYSDASHAGTTKENCNAIIAGGNLFQVKFKVPIQGW